jgi:hypothetical protein
MSPLEDMQRLAALVPRPRLRLHLIRFHGVLAPNAEPRALKSRLVSLGIPGEKILVEVVPWNPVQVPSVKANQATQASQAKKWPDSCKYRGAREHTEFAAPLRPHPPSPRSSFVGGDTRGNAPSSNRPSRSNPLCQRRRAIWSGASIRTGIPELGSH